MPHRRLLVLAYAALVAAWVFTNPVGASPDEPAHLTRALAAAQGDWIGEPARYSPSAEFGPRQLRWINKVARSFDVDTSRVFPGIAPCSAFHPDRSSGCLEASLRVRPAGRTPTYVGTYEPFLYVPLGVGALGGTGVEGAILGGRLVAGALTVLLLGLAVWAVGGKRTGGWPLTGLLLAVSPAVLFLGSSLSPNGLEIAGGVALLAVALRLTASPTAPLNSAADDSPSPQWWGALALAGAVVAMSRSLGPGWVAATLLLMVARAGPAGLVQRIRRAGAPATTALGLVVAAAALTLTWEAMVQPHPTLAFDDLADRILRVSDRLPELLRQMIGVFGWLDTGMPATAYAAWRIGLVGLVVLAFAVGSRRDRLVLLGTLVAVIVGTVALGVLAINPTGFSMQGRYVLPVTVAVPLLAGEILGRRRPALGPLLPRRLPLVVMFTVPLIHAVGWYANARRHAVGVRGPMLFFGDADWAPPGGWATWAGVVVVACVGMAVAGAREVVLSGGVAAARSSTLSSLSSAEGAAPGSG